MSHKARLHRFNLNKQSSLAALHRQGFSPANSRLPWRRFLSKLEPFQEFYFFQIGLL